MPVRNPCRHGRSPRDAVISLSTIARDEYQLALVVHPNERVRLGARDLEEHLEPARRAGLILPAAYEEWASVAVAADLLVSDHGSAALYAAALDRPLLAAYDGGAELLPGSPMATLLDRVSWTVVVGEKRSEAPLQQLYTTLESTVYAAMQPR